MSRRVGIKVRTVPIYVLEKIKPPILVQISIHQYLAVFKSEVARVEQVVSGLPHGRAHHGWRLSLLDKHLH